MKTPREIAEDVLEREPWATALWDREAAIALVVEAVEESRREVAALVQGSSCSTRIKVGDRVVLTGSLWPFDLRGETVGITDWVGDLPAFWYNGDRFFIYDDGWRSGYSATKVED